MRRRAQAAARELATNGFAGFEPHVWKVAVVVVVGAIMSILNTTIVNVALETLSRELDASLQEIQWVVTAYLLALATVIPVTGWASERFGARNLWVATVAAFVVASVLCGFAWSPESLIAFRVLQGLAGGMIMPIGMIVLSLTAGPARMGRVMSVIGVPMLLGPALGPVLGGLLLEGLSWPWIFFINVPVGLVGLVLAWRLLPTRKAAGHHRLDLKGLAMVSPGLALLTFGVSEIPGHGGVADASVCVPGLAGLALLVGFVRHSLRVPDSLIDVRLFKGARLAAAASTTFLLGIALFGSLVLLPLYFQLVRGEDALHTGLLLAPQGLGAALVMPLTGWLTDRFGGGRVVLGGLALLAAGTVPLTQLGSDTSYALLIGVLVLRGMGLGATMMPAMAAAFAALEPQAVPRATSGLNVAQRVGGSIGVALLAVILESRLAERTGSPADAFAHTFWWALALTLVALIPAALLARREGHARRSAAACPADATAAAAAGGAVPVAVAGVSAARREQR